MIRKLNLPKALALGLGLFVLCAWSVPGALAAPLPGGTLDPLTIPKYVTPLVIPPVMNMAGAGGSSADYDIAVRQFPQQILPAGLPATSVWSYGPAADPTPLLAPDLTGASQFNYPAYTIETTSNTTVTVRWINQLVAIPDQYFNEDGTVAVGAPPGSGVFLPHLLPIDQTLHWANPPTTGCRQGTPTNRTDCATNNPAPYTGPVPIVTHVHGAHVEPHSDGYPEAWWLPAAENLPVGYSTSGSLFDDASNVVPGTNLGDLGYADYSYINDQPATTLWYHDHSLGMTRNNVYAGPAGFWLIRGGAYDLLSPPLPGPAPLPGDGVLALNDPADPLRQRIREIPVVIQDRSFNADGSLFYPASRVFFDGYAGPYIPTSDIAPIWNPEAFFNTMVVNGVTWPTLEVAPALYRLRLLNGCNSRFLNLSMFQVIQQQGGGGGRNRPQRNRARLGAELPFYQIGAEQGFLPKVVMVQTGFATVLPGGGTIPIVLTPAPDPQQALLMGLAERADVIVDFRGLANGTVVRMINTAPDAPFGGFPDVPADPDTTGQVMQFVVNGALNGKSLTDPSGGNPATAPESLVLNPEPGLIPPIDAFRDVSLNEEESGQVCVNVTPSGNIRVVYVSPTVVPPATFTSFCAALGAVPMAPIAALLGTVDKANPAVPIGIPLKWTDTTGTSTLTNVTMADGTVRQVGVTENPTVGNTEEWNIYNFTVDGHPIHMHLVRFQVQNRTLLPGILGVAPIVQPWETGYKDTVIAYPGQITTVRAKFDIEGLYVWHCHIVEHEDNEMMRPYVVSAAAP